MPKPSWDEPTEIEIEVTKAKVFGGDGVQTGYRIMAVAKWGGAVIACGDYFEVADADEGEEIRSKAIESAIESLDHIENALKSVYFNVKEVD